MPSISDKLSREAMQLAADAAAAQANFRAVLVEIEQSLQHTQRMSSAGSKQQHCDRLRQTVSNYIDQVSE